MRLALPSLRTAARPAGTSLIHLLAVLRSRRALATLTDAQLDDIGISRAQARTEAAKPVWDAPASWKN